MDSDEISRRFTFHATTDQQQNDMLKIRSDAAELAQVITDRSPSCREQSLAITALEEAVFWANAAISRPAGAHANESAEARAARYDKLATEGSGIVG